MEKSDTGQETRQATLIASLMNPDAYPHSVSEIGVLETHISWVILAGEFAYKIKKSVTLDFLDFSTLDLRRHFCEEELRLNRRWAPDLYLEVVPICGSYEEPSVGGDGEAIEYALKMWQFEQESQLDRQLEAGLLSEDDMLGLAETIAGYQQDAQVLPFATEQDAVDHVRLPMLDNFPHLQALADADRLQHVRDWTENSLRDLDGKIVQRRRDGFVRECHGDLNLTNLVRLSTGIAPYDCVEFAPELRNIDVISDISFLVMDLAARDRPDLAYVLVNRYLECSGDYLGMGLFGLYFVYHGMIRAKIAAIRSHKRARGPDRQRDVDEFTRYLEVASQWIERSEPVLIAMHGFSGSGKTWLSSQLLASLPAIRVRSDVERKRLHGLQETAHSESALGQGIYTKEATSAVYKRMQDVAEGLLRAGFNVILDASFLQRGYRREIKARASKQSVGFVILDVTAGRDELFRRLRARSSDSQDASEADTMVLQHQYESSDALTGAECKDRIDVDTEEPVNISEIVARIKKLSD